MEIETKKASDVEDHEIIRLGDEQEDSEVYVVRRQAGMLAALRVSTTQELGVWQIASPSITVLSPNDDVVFHQRAKTVLGYENAW